MDRNQASAREFMQKARQTVRSTPELPTQDEAIRCAGLIMEEVLETIRDGLGLEPFLLSEGPEFISIALGKGVQFRKRSGHEPSLVDIADGIADSAFVLLCLANACGIDIQPVIEEVCRHNLLKFGPGSYRNSDGKWVKPEGMEPPRIADILHGQSAKEKETEG